MLPFGLFVVIAAVIATAYGENVYVSKSTRDYFHLAQREILHTIDAVDNEIISVEARSLDRRDVVQYQQKQSLAEIRQVNSTLVPLQALSLTHKQCIKMYSPQLTSYAEAESELRTCYGSAALTAKYSTTYARNNAELARAFSTSELSRYLASCDYFYVKNQTALELCYIQYVNVASTSVDTYLKNARDQLRSSLFYTSEASKTGVKCTFRVEKKILLNIEQTAQRIRECEESLKSSNPVNVARSKNLDMAVQQLLTGQRGRNKITQPLSPNLTKENN